MTDLSDENERELAQIFINLGASESQAPVMAAQLLKRAGQIAEERGISKVEATETLLKQVFAARQGA
ncbi:hypothetical protein SH580_16050 [Coraliomargarita algicola]|uniref:Uncharacterized protein n=1 Tax=Coraliomargarita algicola TaxID=3092156 RepID=A0ABZ0RJ19_9BACT|nr:hypothetical protein [Coraliomargarita sp. J2-16]WPJ94942.1 hypothetical protein SH580_16050 [Coraliomargarita sp. J2-16]